MGRWIKIIGASPAANAYGASLLARWAEPHRHYHDLDHLIAVLDHLDALVAAEPDVAVDADAVRLGAFFHDAVYDAARSDNESRSAALAEEVLTEIGVDDAVVREVVRLVELTATHEVAPSDRNGSVLCDADLAVLATDPDSYAAYAAAVRQEYAQVPEPLFRAGRSRVLRTLLDRDQIYGTATGRAWWEAAARRNLAAELVRLSAAVEVGAPEADAEVGGGASPRPATG